MTAYAIFIRDEMKDPDEFAIYREKGRAARGDHPLTVLAYYGAHEVLEGDASDGVVVLSFPSMEAAKAWYHSPGYQAAKVHRDRAANYRVVLVEALAS